MREAIRLTGDVFLRLARGEALNHPRRRLVLPGGSVLHCMAGSDGKYFGAKIYSTHPRHGAHFLFPALPGRRRGPAGRDGGQFFGANPHGRGYRSRDRRDGSEGSRSRGADRRGVSGAGPVGSGGRRTPAPSRPGLEPLAGKAPGLRRRVPAPSRRRELPAELIARADCVAVDSCEQARMESGDLLLSLGETAWRDPRVVELADVVYGKVIVRSAQTRSPSLNRTGWLLRTWFARGLSTSAP